MPPEAQHPRLIPQSPDSWPLLELKDTILVWCLWKQSRGFTSAGGDVFVVCKIGDYFLGQPKSTVHQLHRGCCIIPSRFA